MANRQDDLRKAGTLVLDSNLYCRWGGHIGLINNLIKVNCSPNPVCKLDIQRAMRSRISRNNINDHNFHSFH